MQTDYSSKKLKVTTGKTNNNISDKDLIHLVDEFAMLEGRRPRILVTLTDNNLSSQFNETSSSLADLGFDVDIAPRFMSYESLSRQAIEKVAGNRIAIATAAPTPGIAPMITPPTDPTSSAASTSHRANISIDASSVSIDNSEI